MAGFNDVVMLGNLTRDPELSYTPNNTAVVDVGLAVNRKWRGNDGATHEETCFIDVRAFGSLAENLTKYQHKGNLLLVQGHLTFEQWEKGGTKHSRHRLIADSVQFMPNGKAHEPGEDRDAEKLSR